MSSNYASEDLRSIKTEKALYEAMFSLLKKSHFSKITIKAVCEEALISRATFYAHFIDKYDLLKHWMADLFPKDIAVSADYEQVEKLVNEHICDNMLILKNLVYEADSETNNVLFNFILSIISLNISDSGKEEPYPKTIVLSNFYAGGLISYLSWQTKNRFPAEVPLMNRYLYDMIHAFQSGDQITRRQETI